MLAGKLSRLRSIAAGYRSAVREFGWRLSRAGRANWRWLAELRDAYAGRRCFVLGSGPSLRLTDVRLLSDEVTIGSNALFLLFEETGFRPTFLTVEDRLVAEDRASALNALRGSTKIFPRDLAYCLRGDSDTLFVDFVRRYDGFPRFADDFARIVYWGGTVTFMNLQLAYYLGCTDIYLIGMDHSYAVPPGQQSPVITSTADDVNHFDPRYFGKGLRWHDPRLDRMEASYRVARAFLEAHGVKVFNATPGGRLEIFERTSFESVVRGA